jgi:hypothetical protein
MREIETGADARPSSNDEAEPKSKYLGTFAGIMFFSDERMPKDQAILGYPDGKGGFLDGWVKIVNMGAEE